MKAGGIVMVVFGGLLLLVCAFFGIFSVKNAAAAERLQRDLGPRGGGFIVRIVEKKAETQRTIAIGSGIPALLLLGGGVFMMKKSRG